MMASSANFAWELALYLWRRLYKGNAFPIAAMHIVYLLALRPSATKDPMMKPRSARKSSERG